MHGQALYSSVTGSDDSGALLTFNTVSGSSSGGLVFNADGTFQYTPNPGFVGTDGFEFEVSNGTETDSASVTIDVYNTAPEAYDDSQSVLHDQTLHAFASGHDPDGDMLDLGSFCTTWARTSLASARNDGFNEWQLVYSYNTENPTGSDALNLFPEWSNYVEQFEESDWQPYG